MGIFLIDCEKEIPNIEFDINNLLIDQKIEIGIGSYKYLLYYDKNNAKEIYIKTPKIRLIYDWNTLKYSQVKLRLTPKYNKINKFIDFIENLEEKIIQHKKFNKKKTMEFKSLLHHDNNITYLKAFCNEEKIKITSDMPNKTYKITDFKANAEIQLILKINNIWQKNNSYGLACNIYQVKYYAPLEDHEFDFFSNNICDINDNKITNIVNNTSIKHINNTEHKKIEIPKKIPFVINPSLLQSVKLKPAEKII